MIAYFNLSGKRRLGHVVGLNHHTLWVRVMKGAKTSFTIKRHLVKHMVKIISEGSAFTRLATAVRAFSIAFFSLDPKG